MFSRRRQRTTRPGDGAALTGAHSPLLRHLVTDAALEALHGSASYLFHICPIDLDPEAGIVIQVNQAAAHFCRIFVEMFLKRVPVVASMVFRAKGSFAKCGNQMAMDMRRGVRGDQDTLLLRQMGDTQRLGEARMPSRTGLISRRRNR